MTSNEQLRVYQQTIEQGLGQWLPPSQAPFASGRIPALLNESMRYSLLGGGKRIRGSLLLAAVDLLEGDPSEALVFAMALEMIHAYSLVHDDLPGMDDDDLRRGKPTNHKVYGEGIAILTGDALLNMAYEIMLEYSAESFAPKRLLLAMSEISRAAGVTGMVAGQCVDLASEGRTGDAETLAYIHQHKTGDLMTVPLVAGAILCDAYASDQEALRSYGQALGLAFQITDDLLDIEGQQSLMGKSIGKDQRQGKLTYPALFGVEKSRKTVRDLAQEAQEALENFGNGAWFLRALCTQLTDRNA